MPRSLGEKASSSLYLLCLAEHEAGELHPSATDPEGVVDGEDLGAFVVYVVVEFQIVAELDSEPDVDPEAAVRGLEADALAHLELHLLFRDGRGREVDGVFVGAWVECCGFFFHLWDGLVARGDGGRGEGEQSDCEREPPGAHEITSSEARTSEIPAAVHGGRDVCVGATRVRQGAGAGLASQTRFADSDGGTMTVGRWDHPGARRGKAPDPALPPSAVARSSHKCGGPHLHPFAATSVGPACSPASDASLAAQTWWRSAKSRR